MKYSIIIPAYNASGYIRKALDSIASQTYKDYELIVVCDRCKDDTAEIAAEYGAKIVETDYGSTGLARNAGLDAATGDFVMFLDDDDWWISQGVLTRLNEEVDRADIVCFGFFWRYRGRTGPMTKRGGHWPAVWCKCWRRSVIGNTRFPGSFPEDVEFTNEMLRKFPRIRSIDDPLYYYNYFREGSISRQRFEDGFGPDLRKGEEYGPVYDPYISG